MHFLVGLCYHLVLFCSRENKTNPSKALNTIIFIIRTHTSSSESKAKRRGKKKKMHQNYVPSQIPAELLGFCFAVCSHASSAFIDKGDSAMCLSIKSVRVGAGVQPCSSRAASRRLHQAFACCTNKRHNLINHTSSHRAFPTFFYIIGASAVTFNRIEHIYIYINI